MFNRRVANLQADNNGNEETLAKQFMNACVLNDRDKLNSILRTRKDRKVPARLPDNNKSPLHYAVLEGSSVVVRAVLANQRNINMYQRENENGRTALALACSIRGIAADIIIDILEARPQLAIIGDNRNRTPIDFVWLQNRPEIFLAFFERIEAPLSNLALCQELVLYDILNHQEILNAIYSERVFSHFWRQELFRSLFQLDYEYFKFALVPLKSRSIDLEVFISMLNNCSKAIHHILYSANPQERAQEANLIAKKLFWFMHIIGLSRSTMFEGRDYFFQQICTPQENIVIDFETIQTIAGGVRPYVSASTLDSAYNVLRPTLPFKHLRNCDKNVLSLKNLARDAIREKCSENAIQRNVLKYYSEFKKIVPEKIAQYILHIEDSSWIEN